MEYFDFVNLFNTLKDDPGHYRIHIKRNFEDHYPAGYEYFEDLIKAIDKYPHFDNPEHKNRIITYCNERIAIEKRRNQDENRVKELNQSILTLTQNNLDLANKQLNQRRITFVIGGLIGIVASILGGMIPALVERYTTRKTPPTQVQILNYPTMPDTTKILIIDSLINIRLQKDSVNNP